MVKAVRAKMEFVKWYTENSKITDRILPMTDRTVMLIAFCSITPILSKLFGTFPFGIIKCTTKSMVCTAKNRKKG